MAGDEILRSYGDVGIKEDVLGLVEILTARRHNSFCGLKTNSDKGNAVTQTLGKVHANI